MEAEIESDSIITLKPPCSGLVDTSVVDVGAVGAAEEVVAAAGAPPLPSSRLMGSPPPLFSITDHLTSASMLSLAVGEEEDMATGMLLSEQYP